MANLRDLADTVREYPESMRLEAAIERLSVDEIRAGLARAVRALAMHTCEWGPTYEDDEEEW